MIKPQVTAVDAATWATAAATLIMAAVSQASQACGSCSVVLTGGRSAARLYEAWAALPEFDQIRNVRFYFGDERCVPLNHPDSNYRLAMHKLFQRGVPLTCEVIRMAAEQPDHTEAAAAYEQQLPDRLNVLLLSVGEDGHIASLFPHSSVLHENHRRVVPITGPKPPFQRLTITPIMIQNASEVFVLALGKQKRAVYEEAQRNPADIEAIPARLVLNRTWIFGE